MAVLTYSEIESLMLDDLQANVAVDPPVTVGVANQAGRFINDAYATIWEMSGGRIKKVPSAAAWDQAQRTTGTAQGLLTDVSEVLHVFSMTGASAIPFAVLTCTIAGDGVSVTSSSGFGSVVVGMAVSGTGVLANTFVNAKTSSSAITLSRAATPATVTLTFSPVESADELDRVELARIQWLRTNSGFGTYLTPKVYCPVLLASPGLTDVNKVALEYWPGTTGYYFPMHYVAQFVPMDATVTTPDVNDIEARDIAHLAALNLAPLTGRARLATAISLKLSENTRLGLERKMSAQMFAKQDT